MLKLQDLVDRPDFMLGQLAVSPARRLVSGPAGNVQVEPLTMQVLLILVDAGGRVVTRNELFEQCWGGMLVGDDSLNRVIGKVRRIESEVAPGSFALETIPRTGYRLTGELAQAAADDGPFGNRTATRPGGVSRRALLAGSGAAALAVASFSAWRYFMPRTDARFTELVEQADQIIRHEYSERRLGAIPLLEQALDIHPNDSAALGLMAYARALGATNAAARGEGAMAAAERSIKEALAADSADPHARLAMLLLGRDRFEWAQTEDALRSVLRNAPRNPLAMGWLVAIYQAAGRNQLSWKINEAQIKFDPLSPSPQYRRALKLWIFGRTGEADRVVERLIQIWPRHPWVWNAGFLIFAFSGRAHAALGMIDNAETRPQSITPARMDQWRPTLIALETRRPADIGAAREANLVAAGQSPGQAAYAVMALSGLGEIDAAFDVAEGFLLSKGRIVTRRPTNPQDMLVNNSAWRQTQWLSTPPLGEFRAHARFGPLCDAIGLTAYWRTRGIRPDYPNLSTT